MILRAPCSRRAGRVIPSVETLESRLLLTVGIGNPNAQTASFDIPFSKTRTFDYRGLDSHLPQNFDVSPPPFLALVPSGVLLLSSFNNGAGPLDVSMSSVETSAQPPPRDVLSPPDANVMEANGTFDDNHPEHTLGLSVHPGDLSLDLSLMASPPPPHVHYDMALLSADGNTIAYREDVSKADLTSVNFPLPPANLAGSMYIRISRTIDSSTLTSSSSPPSTDTLSPVAANGSLGLRLPSNYILVVVRHTQNVSSFVPQSTQTPSSPSTSASTDSTARLQDIPSLSIDFISAEESPWAVSASPESSPALVTSPLATGPLPTRSAAPLGGVLTPDDDPTPRVEPVDLASNSETFPNIPAEPIEFAEIDPEFAVEFDQEAVMEFRGPGGFPAVASTLIARNASPRSDHLSPTNILLSRPLIAPSSPPVGPTTSLNSRDELMDDLAAETAEELTSLRKVGTLAGVSVAIVFVSAPLMHEVSNPTATRKRIPSWIRRFLPSSRA